MAKVRKCPWRTVICRVFLSQIYVARSWSVKPSSSQCRSVPGPFDVGLQCLLTDKVVPLSLVGGRFRRVTRDLCLPTAESKSAGESALLGGRFSTARALNYWVAPFTDRPAVSPVPYTELFMHYNSSTHTRSAPKDPIIRPGLHVSIQGRMHVLVKRGVENCPTIYRRSE